MLSVAKLGAGSAGGIASYHESETETNREDYYRGEQSEGRWAGGLAEQFAQRDAVLRHDQLRRVLEGFDPETNKPLARNAGQQHKCGWDLTFSAPKSVSVIWATADAETRARIEAAQNAAAARALRFLEDRGAFTSKERGAESRPVKVLAAQYQHGASREADPQLHTHTIVANMCQRADGTMGGAVDFDTRWKMSAGAVYRAELASAMKSLGYGVEQQADGTFEIAGVSKQVRDAFSARRAQIEKALFEKGMDSAKAAAVAALDTRAAKDPRLTRGELLERWQTQARELGFSAEATRGVAPAAPESAIIDPLDDRAVASALTEQESVFTRQRVYQTIAARAAGRLNADQIDERVSLFLKSDALLRLRVPPQEVAADRRVATPDIFTTKEMRGIETEMIQRTADLMQDRAHAVDQDTVARTIRESEAAQGFALSGEQRAAVRAVCADTGAIAMVRGYAGAGKTTALNTARTAWESGGFRVVGAAVAGKAAKGLQDGAGIESRTIASLLKALDPAPDGEPNAPPVLDEKTVLVIDEAGMVGARQMARLVAEAQRAGAKLVLVGDESQLQPIDAGGAFKALAARGAPVADLVENRRQKTDLGRQLAAQVRAGETARALVALDDAGGLRIAQDRAAAMADLIGAWRNAPSADRLILAATRADVAELNHRARAEMIAAGKVDAGIAVSTANGVRTFGRGDSLLFTQNDKYLDVKNGTRATVRSVVEINGRAVISADVDGRDVRFLVGDREDKNTMAYARRERLSVYDAIDHGYASTVHKAQGATTDYSFIYGVPADREMAYTAMTRHRQRAAIFLTDSMLDRIEDEAGIDMEARDVAAYDQAIAAQSEVRSRRLRAAAAQMTRSEQKGISLDYRAEDQAQKQEQKRLADYSRTADEARAAGTLDGTGPRRVSDLPVSENKVIDYGSGPFLERQEVTQEEVGDKHIQVTKRWWIDKEEEDEKELEVEEAEEVKPDDLSPTEARRQDQARKGEIQDGLGMDAEVQGPLQQFDLGIELGLGLELNPMDLTDMGSNGFGAAGGSSGDGGGGGGGGGAG